MRAGTGQGRAIPGDQGSDIDPTKTMGDAMGEEPEQVNAALAARVAEHERALQEYWDARAENPFLDLGQLLYYTVGSPAKLATAIENHGIQGWDKFGRFGSFEATSPQGQQALDALAVARSLFVEKGTYRLDEFFDAPFDGFGWFSDVIPDLDLIAPAGPAAPDEPPGHSDSQARELKIRRARELTHVIGALLMFIRGEVSEHKHPEYSDQSNLIGFLDVKFDGFAGVSESNLTKLFADANSFMKSPPKKR